MLSYERWLASCICLVLAMVFIGGFTRLTESGLSITEWKPITGIVPPLTQEDWLVEFEKYKNTPEYKLRYFDISYVEFKFIYLVEYVHRLVGRLTGLVFIAGFLYFRYKGRLSEASCVRLVLVLLLGTAQGFIGWYMVKSGLIDVPAVSHYRLALHLGCASALFMLLVYEFLPVTQIRSSTFGWSVTGGIAITLLCGQVLLGGLVAGLRAGLVYNTFPLMNGEFLPAELLRRTGLEWFSDPVCVQFLHRMNGFLVSFMVFLAWIGSCFCSWSMFMRVSLLMCLVLAQMFFGVLTLVFQVPVDIALVHQLMAFLLLGVSVSFLKVVRI
ncbi:COX15/CtaA family protein [Neorickettsia helminthoeca]|nr:COX15/CtaA family protein [Neorickettsia helminthoeca]